MHEVDGKICKKSDFSVHPPKKDVPHFFFHFFLVNFYDVFPSSVGFQKIYGSKHLQFGRFTLL